MISKQAGYALALIILLVTSCSNSAGNDPAEFSPGETDSENEVHIQAEESQITDDDVFTADPVWQIVNNMTLREKIGQMLLIQFRYNPDGSGLQHMQAADLQLLRSVKPGGVILFRENFETVPQVVNLVSDLLTMNPNPPFIAVDEEGGLVSRLVRSGNIPATVVPSAETIGATHRPESAAEIYGIIARELKALGLNMNFAPVADVLTDPHNPVIRTRAFSSDPEAAAAMVASAVRGLQENGVISVVKHFPGHGDSSGDSHFDEITLPHDMERLRAVELLPFKSAIEAGVQGIMTAHMYFPEIEKSHLPASLSPVFLRQILREELGFNGLIITDALEMRGIRGIESPEAAGVQAVLSGADMLLIPPDPLAQLDSIMMQVIYGRIPEKYIDNSVYRIISVKISQGIWYNQHIPDEDSALEILGNASHRDLLSTALRSHP